MVMHMSGTRANGEKYPPGWTAFEVADWEGEHLIRGGCAREVAAPAPPPAPVPPAPEPPAAPEPAPAPSFASEPAPAPEPEAAPEPAPEPAGDSAPAPAPNAPKQAWVDYAISQGLDWDTASRMTKADLQSRFGPRL